MRPEQWLKNGFVLAPIVFSGLVHDPVAWARSLAAVVAFCAASSAVYLVNDVIDREADRAHPEKSGDPSLRARFRRRWRSLSRWCC